MARHGKRSKPRRHRATFETLEVRNPLAADFQFSESRWGETLGRLETITAVGDFDGDGIDEFVGEARESIALPENAWYRLNRATNRFEAGGSLPAQTETGEFKAIGVADMDSDGDQDLVMKSTVDWIDTYSQYRWIENSDGRGTFTAIHGIGGFGNTYGHLADVDLDGDVDLSYIAFFQSFPITYRGWMENVGGNMTHHELPAAHVSRDDRYDINLDGVLVIPPAVPTIGGVVTGDLNRDGQLDELYADGRWLTIKANTLSFSRLPGTNDQSNCLFDDIDRDSDLDVWIQNGAELKWLENDGSANFTEHLLSSLMPDRLILAQMDADGPRELVVQKTDSRAVVWYDLDAARSQLVAKSNLTPNGDTPQDVVDLNRDGRLDVLGVEAWYEATNDPRIWVTHAFANDWNAERITSADVDGDGLTDLLYYTSTRVNQLTHRSLKWSRQQTDGSFGAPIEFQVVIPNEWPNVSTSVPWELLADDLDADGDTDLAIMFPYSNLGLNTGTLSWYENTNGAGAFQKRDQLIQAEQIVSLAGWADVTGDAHKDLLVNTLNGVRTFIRASDGSARFTETLLLTPSTTTVLGTGDLDGDGDTDLVGIDSGKVRWYRNLDGRGTFTHVTPTIASIDNVTKMSVADFDGDGDEDLVLHQDTTPPPDPIGRFGDLIKTYNYHFFENIDGRDAFLPSGASWINRGGIHRAVDLDGNGRADFIELPQGMHGIILQTNITPAPLLADVNGDSNANVHDLDAMGAALLAGSTDRVFDLNRDGLVNRTDFNRLVDELPNVPRGDANGDGRFNSSDLVEIFAKGGYENRAISSLWSGGDWDGDGFFNSSDLILAMQESLYEDVVPGARRLPSL